MERERKNKMGQTANPAADRGDMPGKKRSYQKHSGNGIESQDKSETTDDNFILVPPSVIESLMAYRIPGEQMQILAVIIRKTYGFNKKSDWIAGKQFHRMTGISRRNCLRAVSALEKRRIILVDRADKSKPKYLINEKIKQWVGLSKKASSRVI